MHARNTWIYSSWILQLLIYEEWVSTLWFSWFIWFIFANHFRSLSHIIWYFCLLLFFAILIRHFFVSIFLFLYRWFKTRNRKQLLISFLANIKLCIGQITTTPDLWVHLLTSHHSIPHFFKFLQKEDLLYQLFMMRIIRQYIFCWYV